MRNLIFIILLLANPSCSFANNTDLLREFIGPVGNQTNVYSCNFPCAYISVKGAYNESDSILLIEETTQFSEKICGDNTVPCNSISTYSIGLSGDSLIRKNKSGSSVIIKLPLDKSTEWKVGTNELGKGNSHYLCAIEEIYEADILRKKRMIVRVGCSSKKTKEIITTEYASGIGLLERKSQVNDNIVHRMVLDESKTIDLNKP